LGSITSEPYQVMWTPAENLRTQLVTLSIYVYDNAGNITRDAGGQKQVSFVLDGQVLITTRFYLNQRALGVNGDEMCSMSSIAMILASAGKIQSDYPSLRDAANEAYKTLSAPGAQRVADYLNTEALGMNASIVWSQDKEFQWTHITGEINAGRPLILSNPRNGGTVTQWGHYMVIVGFVESSIPSLRQIIVYDPYGAWRGSLNSYDRNSASPDPPEGVKGRQVIYNWSSFGTTYLIETHPLNGSATTPLDTTLPDEVFILDTPDIVTYLGHGESPYPFQLFLPEITR
jgi:hypothetical protein